MPRSAPSRTDEVWPADAGQVLLPLARAAIAEALGLPGPQTRTEEWLDQPGASFVTLHLRDAPRRSTTSGRRLRGCIGTISAYRSIAEDVRGNARNAAFRDPRFDPVSPEEYADLELEVSLLSPMEPVECRDEDELIEVLRPGTDGVLLEAGDRRGTFLPQVWDQLPRPRDFVTHLKAKAGVGGRRWDSDWRVSRYTVTAWSE